MQALSPGEDEVEDGMTKGTLEEEEKVENVASGMEKDGIMDTIVNNDTCIRRDTNTSDEEEEGLTVVQLVIDKVREEAKLKQSENSMSLEVPQFVLNASFQPPTHPDSRHPSTNLPTTASIGKTADTTFTSPRGRNNPTSTKACGDSNVLDQEAMIRDDDFLVVPPPALSLLASSSYSVNTKIEDGRIIITSSVSPSTTNTVSGGKNATAMVQLVHDNSRDVNHDEIHTKRHPQHCLSIVTNGRNNIHEDEIMNYLLEQSPILSDHSADSAAEVCDGIGRVCDGGAATTNRNIWNSSSSSSNNLMNDVHQRIYYDTSTTAAHDSAPAKRCNVIVRSVDGEMPITRIDAAPSIRGNRDQNSTAQPSTSSLFLEQNIVLQSGTMGPTSDTAAGGIPRKVSFDEESSIPPPGKELNLEEKLSGLLQRQRRSQIQSEKSADDNDMMMISRSRTFDSSFTNKSTKSSALESSIASSAQISIESACVRQNAQLAEMMEDAMMDFFVLAQAAESNNDTTTSPDAIPYSDEEEVQARTAQTSTPGLFFVGEDGRIDSVANEVNNLIHHLVVPSPSTSPTIREAAEVPASPHKLPRLGTPPSADDDDKDLAKFLVQFSEHILNGCNNYETDSSDVFSISNSQYGREDDTSRFETNPSDGKLDNKSTDAATTPLTLTRSVAFGRVVSSISEDSEEEDLINSLHHFGKSRSLPNLPPASAFLSAKERARIRQHDTTPVRANTSYARYRKYVHMHSDGDISMASIKEEMVDEEESGDEIEDVEVEKANVNDRGVPISEEVRDPKHSRADDQQIAVWVTSSETFDHHRARRNAENDVDLPSDSSCIVNDLPTFSFNRDAVVTPKLQPEQAIETSVSRPVDPPSSISFDVDHSEDSVTDVIKMTLREKQKGCSLAWHSTNGVNDDELHDIIQPRPKANGGANVAGRINSMSLASYGTMFQQHAPDNDDDDDFRGNAGVERRYQLGLIEETSKEGSDSSDGEYSSSHEEHGESDSYSRVGIGMDQEQATSSSGASSPEASTSLASGSRTPVPAPRFTVRDYRSNSDVRNTTKKNTATDFPPIIRFETQHNARPPSGGPRRVLLKPTSLGGSGPCARRSHHNQELSHAPASRLHPHHVPHELPKSRLKETLRGNSIRDSRILEDCANHSVGTSELGSLFTRESDHSLNLLVPRVIFHNTHPRFSLSLSKTNNGKEFSGDVASSKCVSSSESKSSSCTPDSGYQIINGRQMKNQRQASSLHAVESNDKARDMAAANPTRQIIDIGEIIYNLKAVGSTIAKIGGELFENATTDAASLTQPNGLIGGAADYELPSATIPIVLEPRVSGSSAGTAATDSNQLERIIMGTKDRDDIEKLASDADPATSEKEQMHTDIKPQQHNSIAVMKANTRSKQSTLKKANSSTSGSKQRAESFWRKLDEQNVRSFWSQLELDDELSTSKTQQQQQQQPQRVVPMNKLKPKRVADDASASYHSSIFEAFEVAPLREKSAFGPRNLLSGFGVHHSCVKPGSFKNDAVFPETAVDTVLHDESGLGYTACTDMHERSRHSADAVNNEQPERSRVSDNEVPQRSLTDKETSSYSFPRRHKALLVVRAHFVTKK